MLMSSSVCFPTMDEYAQLLEDLVMFDADDEPVVDVLDADGADPVVSFVG